MRCRIPLRPFLMESSIQDASLADHNSIYPCAAVAERIHRALGSVSKPMDRKTDASKLCSTFIASRRLQRSAQFQRTAHASARGVCHRIEIACQHRLG